jgi:hypothetical protein
LAAAIGIDLVSRISVKRTSSFAGDVRAGEPRFVHSYRIEALDEEQQRRQ